VVRFREPPPAGASILAGRPASVLIGAAGLALTLFAMLIATVPPSGSAEPWLFRVKVIGGAGFFVVVGLLIYWRGRR